jgi:hypothetical protein
MSTVCLHANKSVAGRMLILHYDAFLACEECASQSWSVGAQRKIVPQDCTTYMECQYLFV